MSAQLRAQFEWRIRQEVALQDRAHPFRLFAGVHAIASLYPWASTADVAGVLGECMGPEWAEQYWAWRYMQVRRRAA